MTTASAVDVIMITYNHEAYVEAAITSVLEQDSSIPIRLLVSDDASTDETPALLRKMAQRDSRIHLTLREQNVGMHENLAGIWNKATAPYIALLDGDDRWISSAKLRLQIALMDAHPSWQLSFHPVREVSTDGHVVFDRWPAPSRLGLTFEHLATENFIPTCSVIYRRIPGLMYPSWLHGLPMGDWPLHLLHAASGEIGFIDEVWGEYRLHDGGVWSGLEAYERDARIIRTIDALLEHGAQYGLSRRPLERHRVCLLQDISVELALCGAYRQSLKSLTLAMGSRPFDAHLLRSRLQSWKSCLTVYPLTRLPIRLLRLLARRFRVRRGS